MFIKNLNRKLFKFIRRIPTEVYVFFVSFLYRLPSLGYDFINNDAFLWKGRGYAFGSALTSFNFAETAVTYHPGVPLLWLQFVAIKVYSLLIAFGLIGELDGRVEFLVNHQIQKIIVVIASSILITIAYSLLKSIIGKKFSLLVFLVFLTEPFFVGLSRAIHTDAIISLFMFISVLFFYKYLNLDADKNITWNGLFAGVFAGLAFLTKSSALFLIPYILLIAFIYLWKERKKRVLYKVLFVFGFSILTFFIVWPAMWVDSVGSIRLYLFEGVQSTGIEAGHEHVWFGEVTSDPGFLFYPIVLVGRYSIVLILTFLISFYFLFKDSLKSIKGREVSIYHWFVLFIIFYLLMLTMASKKLDRYTLPILLPICVLSSYAILKVLERKLLLVFVLVFGIYRSAILYGLHPNYLAYYSPAVGGVERGRFLIEPKWLVGYDKVAEYFNQKQKEEGRVIKVAIADFDYLRPFAEFEVLNIKNEPERDQAEYFILPAYREDRNDFYIRSYNVEKSDTTIDVVGVEYYYIYIVKGKLNK